MEAKGHKEWISRAKASSPAPGPWQSLTESGRSVPSHTFSEKLSAAGCMSVRSPGWSELCHEPVGALAGHLSVSSESRTRWTLLCVSHSFEDGSQWDILSTKSQPNFFHSGNGLHLTLRRMVAKTGGVVPDCLLDSTREIRAGRYDHTAHHTATSPLAQGLHRSMRSVKTYTSTLFKASFNEGKIWIGFWFCFLGLRIW